MSFEAQSTPTSSEFADSLDVEATVVPANDSCCKFVFEGHIRSLLLKRIASYGCAEAPRNGVCDIHKTVTILVLFGL